MIAPPSPSETISGFVCDAEFVQRATPFAVHEGTPAAEIRCT
jgi:hypothetical protein